MNLRKPSFPFILALVSVAFLILTTGGKALISNPYSWDTSKSLPYNTGYFLGHFSLLAASIYLLWYILRSISKKS